MQRRIGDWHDWQQLDEIAREILDPERDGALLTRIGRNRRSGNSTGRSPQPMLSRENICRCPLRKEFKT